LILHKPIKVGIDLDNTIISYDAAFQRAACNRGLIGSNIKYSKQEISNEIKNRTNGEIEWQKLQGYVYGKGIKTAHIFPSVYRFLWRCRNKGVIVEIVSHKTKYGHFDKDKCSLREAATQFLKTNNILQDNSRLVDKITFTNTQQDKIDYIKNNSFDYFIDDLEEIVNSKCLSKTETILFNGATGKTWDEVNTYLLGGWGKEELMNVIKTVLPAKTILSLEKIEGRANSLVCKIVTNDAVYVSKIYPQSGGHDRLAAEYNSLKQLKELSIPHVQTPVSCDKNLGVAIYNYIDGTKVLNHSCCDVKQMLSILSELNSQQVKDKFATFNLASNVSLSGHEIELQIRERLISFNNAKDEYLDLKMFINNKFTTAVDKIISWSQDRWPNSYTEKLPKSELVLSPSDFGFHNAIRSQSGELYFHDFEYFGWDDPVKLIADVSHHAAFELSSEQEQLWLNGCIKIYGYSVLERYKTAWPLYGLIWCLIILNEYNSTLWNRRTEANNLLKDKKDEILHVQLKKAEKQLNRVLERYDKI
jgi:hypothetical protein